MPVILAYLPRLSASRSVLLLLAAFGGACSGAAEKCGVVEEPSSHRFSGLGIANEDCPRDRRPLPGGGDGRSIAGRLASGCDLAEAPRMALAGKPSLLSKELPGLFGET
mgnify:CR=1 FL=1